MDSIRVTADDLREWFDAEAPDPEPTVLVGDGLAYISADGSAAMVLLARVVAYELGPLSLHLVDEGGARVSVFFPQVKQASQALRKLLPHLSRLQQGNS